MVSWALSAKNAASSIEINEPPTRTILGLCESLFKLLKNSIISWASLKDRKIFLIFVYFN
ncbi:hypothetical protein BpHYR1_013371 [Brachionus plicatilis]|uniref:Uncharacterized protein n=1 Tax=Brachionus plicatilis TaxID=10195 RepID=A0A3M7SZD9_BRAPC|nr:hypothetical protein BpHYR1_013371 [Brachionus plicatilis]